MGTDGEAHSNDAIRRGDLLAFDQCSRRAWLERHRPSLKTDDRTADALRKQAAEVREAAVDHPFLKGCVPVKRDSLEASISATREAMENPDIPGLLQPTLESDGVVGEPDALVRGENGGWWVVAIRSSMRVKKGHVTNLAIDAHALTICGYSLAGASLVHLNPDYLRTGALDLKALFVVADVSDQLSATDEVASWVQGVRDVLALPAEPAVETGRHCNDPFSCPFIGHCTGPMLKHDIRRLPRHHKLAQQGFEDAREVPEHLLNGLQKRALDCILENREYVSDDLHKTLAYSVEFPLYFLDFEGVAPALPIDGRSPYQSFAMAWTVCVLSANGAIRTMDYINTKGLDGNDMRFAQTLRRALGEQGTIFVYSSYESALMRRLSVPDLEENWFEPIVARFVDLLDVLRKHYYHPAMNGSFSNKRLLPIVAPGLTYEDLSVQNGAELANELILFHSDHLSPGKRAKSLRNIREYCRRDTLSEVWIYQYLLSRGRSARRFALSPHTGQQCALFPEMEALLKDTETNQP